MEEYILFISCLYYLLAHCHSCCFYKQYHGGMRDYLHANIDILLYIMFYIINMMKKQTLLYHFRTYDTKKVPI